MRERIKRVYSLKDGEVEWDGEAMLHLIINDLKGQARQEIEDKISELEISLSQEFEGQNISLHFFMQAGEESLVLMAKVTKSVPQRAARLVEEREVATFPPVESYIPQGLMKILRTQMYADGECEGFPANAWIQLYYGYGSDVKAWRNSELLAAFQGE